MLTIRNLQVRLPVGADRTFAVNDVSLELYPNEIVCVVGESGSGKSTLAHALLGLLPKGVAVCGGSISFGGEDLAFAAEHRMRQVRGAEMSMIFQEPLTALNPLMRAGDQVGEAIRAHRSIDGADALKQVIRLLREVGISEPERIVRAYPFELSGGQRQRVMIASALAMKPRVLIADEPTTALDVTTQAQVLRLLKQLQKDTGLGILLITHDFGVVAEVAHRVVVMKDGCVVEQGTVDAVLRAPCHEYTRRLIAAVPALRTAAVASAPPSDALLQVRSLHKTYVRKAGWRRAKAEVAATRDVSFDIRVGETYGLVGESGSGKSTLGRMIAGLIEPDRGHVTLGGQDLSRVASFKKATIRRSVQMIFQDPYGSLNPRKRIDEILTMGPRLAGVDSVQAHEQALELLRRVKLDVSSMKRYPHEFSGGQRQRIGIARALMMKPDLLVADEPVSALDVSVQDQVVELLKELKVEFGLSMLFITHDLRVASQLCDRVGVLQRGVLVEEGPPHIVLQSPSHPYTQELISAIPGRHWK